MQSCFAPFFPSSSPRPQRPRRIARPTGRAAPTATTSRRATGLPGFRHRATLYIGYNYPQPATEIYFSGSYTQNGPVTIYGVGPTEVTFDLRGNTLTILNNLLLDANTASESVKLVVTNGTTLVLNTTGFYSANRTLIVADGGVLNTGSIWFNSPYSKVVVGPGGTMSFTSVISLTSNSIEIDSGVLGVPGGFSGSYIRGNGIVLGTSPPTSISAVYGTTNLTQNLTVPTNQVARVFSQGAAGLGPSTVMGSSSYLVVPAAGLVLGQDDVLVFAASNGWVNGNIVLESGILQANGGGPQGVTGTIGGYGVHLGNVSGSVAAPSGTVSLTLPLNVGALSGTVHSQGPASLGGGLTLAGGTLAAVNGVLLPGTARLSGSGAIAGSVAAEAGTAIEAAGTIALGDAGSLTGFRTAGALRRRVQRHPPQPILRATWAHDHARRRNAGRPQRRLARRGQQSRRQRDGASKGRRGHRFDRRGCGQLNSRRRQPPRRILLRRHVGDQRIPGHPQRRRPGRARIADRSGNRPVVRWLHRAERFPPGRRQEPRRTRNRRRPLPRHGDVEGNGGGQTSPSTAS